MNKKDFLAAVIASALIGILTIPTINNLPLPDFLVSLGAGATALILGAIAIVGYFASEALGRYKPIFRQLGRFAVVGILNTVLDFAVLNLLINFTDRNTGAGYAIIKGISFTVAVINSYYWNKYWAFEFKEKVSEEFLQFIAVSVAGLGLNIGAASIVVNTIEPMWSMDATAWANAGALAGTFAGLAWNFIGYKFIVFKKKSD